MTVSSSSSVGVCVACVGSVCVTKAKAPGGAEDSASNDVSGGFTSGKFVMVISGVCDCDMVTKGEVIVLVTVRKSEF